MSIDNITIGQAREIASMLGIGSPGVGNALAPNGKKVIAVLQRGWVVCGDYSQRGDIATLSEAAVVRVWGTSNGLGELAEKGPLEGTILDPCPPVSFHIREAVFVMECSDAWRK